ncbi:MAG: insulinase family protein [Chloroflexota bacterium]|nr:MAG: insulinase family protein [Chloroflexota bacterium]
MHKKVTFDNGLRLLTSKMPHTRSVSIVFFIASGPRYEIEPEAGISHFIEHLCFKGTEKRRSSKEISEAIEGVGGIINGGTDKELTTFWCRVTSEHFLIALDVLTDLLRHSRFDAADIDRERQIIIEEINMSLDSPRQRVSMLIDELMWPGQVLGRDIAGNKETVASITRQNMLDFFSKRYLPNTTVVAVAGDIEHKQVHNTISRALGEWKSSQVSPGFPNKVNQESARLNIEFRETEQAHLCLGVPGLSFFHPDRYAVDLLSIILGEGMSSRLFLEIREQQGLAYDIHSYADHFADSGAVIIHAGVDPGRAEDAIKAIIDQTAKLKEKISQDELKKAKEIAKGRLLLSLESSRNVAAWLGVQELLLNHILTTDEVISMVEAVTTEDLKRVAQQLLTSEKLNLDIVGPVKDEEHMAKLLKL